MSIINTLVKGGGGGTVEVTTNTSTTETSTVSQTVFSVTHEPTEWFIYLNSSYTTTDALPNVCYIGEVNGAYKAHGVFMLNSDQRGTLRSYAVKSYAYDNGTFTVRMDLYPMPFRLGAGKYTLIYI